MSEMGGTSDGRHAPSREDLISKGPAAQGAAGCVGAGAVRSTRA